MDGSVFIVTDRLQHSYITTAALRRSGNHPERVVRAESTHAESHVTPAIRALQQLPDLDAWIRGTELPHSTICQGTQVTMDSTVVLHAFRQAVTLQGCKFIVIPSNEARIIMGCNMAATVDTHLEDDASPLQTNPEGSVQDDVARALRELHQRVETEEPRLFDYTKQSVTT